MNNMLNRTWNKYPSYTQAFSINETIQITGGIGPFENEFNF